MIDADWHFGAGKIQNDLTNVSHPNNNSLKGLFQTISSNGNSISIRRYFLLMQHCPTEMSANDANVLYL